MSEIYPSVRLAIRDSVTRILFDRPGQWLTTHELLNHCEEAETSDALAKILSDMAKTGRLVRGLKTLNAQGREVNTWGLSPRLRDKIMAGQLLAQSQDAGHDAPAPAWQIDAPQTTLASLTPPVASLGTEPPPLPAESSEDEAPAPPAHGGYTLPADKVASTGTTASARCITQGQRATSQTAGLCDFAAVQPPFAFEWDKSLGPPIETPAPKAPAPVPPISALEDLPPPRTPQPPRPASAINEYQSLQPPFAWMIAEPDQPLETPPASTETATAIHYIPLPERWLPELRLRLLGYDGRDNPVITLRVNTEGVGAFWSLNTSMPIAFDPGEAAFLPALGDALCQFLDALYPYGVKPGAK
jgi:hypothetical protein